MAEQYDVTPRERANILERAKIRSEMRSQFLKLYQNPYKMSNPDNGYSFDPNLQRWLSLRAQNYHYFRPTFKSALAPIIFFTVIFLGSRWTNYDRSTREAVLRRGETSYRDRRFKFHG